MGKEKILHTPHKTNTKTPHVARQTTVSYYRNPWALSCYSRLRKVGISCGPWRAWKHVVSKESKLWRLAGNACLLCIDSDALSFGPGIGPRSLTLFPFFPPSALVLSLCVMYNAEERLRVCLSVLVLFGSCHHLRMRRKFCCVHYCFSVELAVSLSFSL